MPSRVRFATALLLLLSAVPSLALAQRLGPRGPGPAPESAPGGFLTSPPAPATGPGVADAGTIAAVVNDQVISVRDLDERIRLVIVSSGIAPSPDVARRLAPQVLRSLIDEKLELQEAKRLNIKVEDKDVQAAITTIERQNKMPPGALAELLRRNGVPMRTLIAQVTATLSWQKVVRQKVAPQVAISDEEVNSYLDQMRARGGATEYLVSEIFLPVEQPADDAEVRQTAEKLIEQIRQGAPFGAVARQFSKSPTAAVGGDMGQVIAGTLDPKLDTVLQQLRPGEISVPIRTDAGYYVLGLREVRPGGGGAADDTVVALKRIFLRFPPNPQPAEIQAQGELAESVDRKVKGCADMDRVARETKAEQPVDMGKIKLADLPDNLKPIVQRLTIGKPSVPLRTNDGYLVLMVCGREQVDGGNGLPTRQAVAENLATQRAEAIARRMLRDLRRAGNIDIRL